MKSDNQQNGVEQDVHKRTTENHASSSGQIIQYGWTHRRHAARNDGRARYDAFWREGERTTKNSYLYCDSVDACFFYGPTGAPTVTFTARWTYGAKDLDRLGEAAELIKTMLYNMTVESVLENLTADSKGNLEDG